MEKDRIIISPDTQRANRVPPGQHLTEKWPVLHYGSVPKIDLSKWTLKIFGLVKEPKTLNLSEFEALPQQKVFSDIHCVTTWSKLNNTWEGVCTAELNKLVTVKAEAKFVIIHAEVNFTTNLTLREFFDEDVLLATRHNGVSLNADHGGPVRLVVPRLYFWKSAKWVTGIEFSAIDKPGFWESNGYHNHGDPWTEERYSHRVL
jgi:DMSO/TMAO reductase YedYZ molybdopterin-dependent catalytic subunit